MALPFHVIICYEICVFSNTSHVFVSSSVGWSRAETPCSPRALTWSVDRAGGRTPCPTALASYSCSLIGQLMCHTPWHWAPSACLGKTGMKLKRDCAIHVSLNLYLSISVVCIVSCRWLSSVFWFVSYSSSVIGPFHPLMYPVSLLTYY